MKKLILAAALLAGPLLADELDPASLMPADTIVYAEANGAALAANVPKLDLVRVLYDKRFASFLEPMRRALPPSAEAMAEPVTRWLKGRAAVGVSGISVRLRNFDGSWERVRITAGSPIRGDLFHKMMRSAWVQRPGPSIVWDLEAVAVVEPGPALRAAFGEFLENPPVKFEQRVVQRGARQVLTLKFEAFEEDDIWMAPEIHAAIDGDRWILATSAELLAEATAKERKRSLAQDAQFAAARKRHTSGVPVAFVYGDARRFLEVARPLLPPAAAEMLDAEGVASIRSFAAGYSIVDGGFRESIGIGLDEDPKGFWRILDACPPGLRSIHKTPKQAVGVVAAKFDPARFVKRFEESVGAIFPGAEEFVVNVWREDFLELGFKFEEDLLPAFGDEAALMVMPPAAVGIPIPDLVLGVELRDEAAFRRVMDSAKAQLTQPPAILKDKKYGESEFGWQMQGPLPAIVQMRLHKSHLLGSTNPLWMRRLVADWGEPAATLAKDNAVFRRVLKGLNGGDTDSLILLAYGDLQTYVPLLLMFAAGTDQLPAELFNTKPMPDVRAIGAELSGLAVGMRRDQHGVALESFSPVPGVVGMYVPTFLYFWGYAPVFAAPEVRRVR